MQVREDLLQIGEFAKLAHTNLRTLRYYEELGLLEPDARSSGGFRYYRSDQVDRMAAIQRLRDLGLSLREVAAALRLDGSKSAPEIAARLESVVGKQIAMLEDKIARLEKDLDGLRAARRRLGEVCRHCDVALSRACDPCPQDHVPLPPALRALL